MRDHRDHPQQTALRPRTCPPERVEVPVRSELDVRGVVAAVMHLCAEHSLPQLLAAHVATAASELANNLWMHTTQGGHITVQLIHRHGLQGTNPGVELRSHDTGPGMADPARAMEEGFSTGGGLGCGLPGVQRLMDEFSLESTLGQGTVVVARRWARPATGGSA
jgi:serine/threonine-protein kinase RsbT